MTKEICEGDLESTSNKANNNPHYQDKNAYENVCTLRVMCI